MTTIHTHILVYLSTRQLIIMAKYAEVPPRVEYALTPRSHSLIPIIDNLIGWAMDNMAAIREDRERKNVG